MTNLNDVTSMTTNSIVNDGIKVTFNSRKANRSIERDLTTLPYVSLMAIARYGAQRFINDKIGGSDVLQPEAAEIFDLWIKALDEGKVVRSVREQADPVETKGKALAMAQVKAQVQAIGKTLKEVGKEKIDKLAADMYEANKETYKEQARNILEAERKQAENAPKVDLSSLGL